MPSLDDGVVIRSGPLIPVPQYLDVSDADDYFSTRLQSEVWFESTQEQKRAALVTATRAIDNLNFVGIKASPIQPLEFPRKGPSVSTNGAAYQPSDTGVPPEILMACCEEAIARLDGVDPEQEMNGVRVVATGYASVREQYSGSYVHENVKAGIMSQTAWNFLVPWLADSLNITLAKA